jgi:hypothetical protein
MFARVEILAPAAAPYAAIPVQAVREGETVWLVEDDTLRIRPIRPLYRLDDEVLVREGLSGGDHVVISGLSAVTDGMAVLATASTGEAP